MPTTQVRNDEMVALLRADMLPLADRNIAFRAYDAVGGQTFTGTAITVALGTVAHNGAPTVFALASDVLTVGAAGVYWVAFQGGAVYDSGASLGAGSVQTLLELDSGAGFVAVPGCAVYAHSVGGPLGPVTGMGALPLWLNADDKLRLRMRRDAGADTFRTAVGGSSLSVVRLVGAE